MSGRLDMRVSPSEQCELACDPSIRAPPLRHRQLETQCAVLGELEAADAANR